MIADGFEGERQRETERDEDKHIQEIDQGRDKKLDKKFAETLVGANFFKKSRPWADFTVFLIIRCDCINITINIHIEAIPLPTLRLIPMVRLIIIFMIMPVFL